MRANGVQMQKKNNMQMPNQSQIMKQNFDSEYLSKNIFKYLDLTLDQLSWFL